MKLNEFRHILKTNAHLPLPEEKAERIVQIKEHYIAPDSREILVRRKRKLGTSLFSVLVMSCMATVIFLGTQVKSTVTVELNPPVTLSVNYFNRVIAIEGENEDGLELIQSLDRKSGTLSSVLDNMLEVAVEEGYAVPSETNYVLLGVNGTSYQTEELLIREISQSDQINPAFSLFVVNRHSDSPDGSLLGGNLRIASSSSDFIFSGLLPAGTQAENTLPTASPDYDYFDDVPIFNPDVESAFDSKNSGDYGYSLQDAITGEDQTLTDEEFADLSVTYQVSEAKMAIVLAIVFNLPGYTQMSDVAYLSNLPVQDLLTLYSRIDSE